MTKNKNTSILKVMIFHSHTRAHGKANNDVLKRLNSSTVFFSATDITLEMTSDLDAASMAQVLAYK